MTLRYALLAVLVLSSAGVRAQAPGECALGRAEGDLDVGDVFARVFNTGSLFYGGSSAAAYIVPKNSGRSPIYAAGLWVGGMVEGELRVAGATYADFEFWPGPLDPATGRPPNAEDCSDFDRIWRVSRHDVAEYYRTGIAARDLAEWPYHLGAPVIDADGDSTNYDLAAGDQPAISGDQMLWWVMNDAGNVHRNTLVEPIGLEVHVSAFAFGSGSSALRQASFYRYTLVNRARAALEDAYVLLWADPDLGDSSDDYAAGDTTRHMAYVYNSDDQDGNGTGGTYGAAPPAVGVQLVQGPVGLPNGRDDDRDGVVDEADERLGATTIIGGHDDVCGGFDPWDGRDAYDRMRGRWRGGSPVRHGGWGCEAGAPVTTFVFPGDPVEGAFWSEWCPMLTANCLPNPSGDRRILVSSGPFRIPVGAEHEFLLAIPFAAGDSNLDSIVRLRRAANVLRNASRAGVLDAQHVQGWPGLPAPPAAIQLRRPAPNPFTDDAVMSITLPAPAGVRAVLVDVLGREVAVLADGPHGAGAHPIAIAGAGLAPGVYVARVWVDGQPAGALPVTRR